jgi:pimeloyl-ACP methyl ester carboxylesterase
MAAGFREGFVAADGFRLRAMEAGEGPALVHLHGAGGLRLTPAHELLSRKYRVVAFEMPGFGASAENTRTRDMAELARTMAAAAEALGLDRFNLMGTSFGGKAALWLGLQQPERVSALVLESPAAIRPPGAAPPPAGQARGLTAYGTPEDMARRLFAHPERQPPLPAVDPQQAEKQAALVRRVFGPPRDPDLEARLPDLAPPTLVLFGTRDAMIPPDMGHLYKELIPDCHLVFVYDAGHAIAAERPEAFTEVVGDFLDRHDAFVVSRTPSAIHP